MHTLFLPTGRLVKIACGYTTASFGHGSQCRAISEVKNTNRPHSSGEEHDSKLGNSLTVIGIFFFFVSKCVIRVHDFIQLEVVRMTM